MSLLIQPYDSAAEATIYDNKKASTEQRRFTISSAHDSDEGFSMQQSRRDHDSPNKLPDRTELVRSSPTFYHSLFLPFELTDSHIAASAGPDFEDAHDRVSFPPEAAG